MSMQQHSQITLTPPATALHSRQSRSKKSGSKLTSLRTTLKSTTNFRLRYFRRAIMKAKPCAPGPDGIHNNLLKHLPEDTLKILKEVLNNVWTSVDFPHKWRAAIMIPIPKPNKDHTALLSYRPIALTSCLYKVLELMISTRFIRYLEKSGILDGRQCGFRKHRPLDESQKVHPKCLCPEAAGSWSLLWFRKGLWDYLAIWYRTRPAQDWAQRQIAYFRIRISLGPPNSSQNWDHTFWWILPRGRCSYWWCPGCDMFWTDD